MTISAALKAAIWAGDQDRCWELAPCQCCCHEHTSEACPARAWEGCRGQGALTRVDIEAWARHYNMSVRAFLGES